MIIIITTTTTTTCCSSKNLQITIIINIIIINLKVKTLNLKPSRAIAFTFGQIPLGKVRTPYPPSYGLNSTTTVLLGEWLWH